MFYCDYVITTIPSRNWAKNECAIDIIIVHSGLSSQKWLNGQKFLLWHIHWNYQTALPWQLLSKFETQIFPIFFACATESAIEWFGRTMAIRCKKWSCPWRTSIIDHWHFQFLKCSLKSWWGMHQWDCQFMCVTVSAKKETSRHPILGISAAINICCSHDGLCGQKNYR